VLTFQLSTFIFQLVNFFILLVVLTRFVYRPLLRVVHRQEEEMVACLRDAEERAKRADAEREQLAQELQHARAQAEELLATARTEAAQIRAQLLERAHQEAAQQLDETKQRVQEQERTARQRLETDLRQTAVAMTAGLLQAAAGPLLHNTLIEQLLGEGLRLDGDQGELLRRAHTQADGSVTVEVAYPLAPGLEARVREVLATAVGRDGATMTVTFRTEPLLLAGARLLVGGVAVDLSLSRTLAELSQQPAAEEAQG
jgi:F-type H+-transporting ATPase subunit b